jgi:hypothetical protein
MFELKHPVLLTRFPEIYHLTSYLRRYTNESIRFVVGASTLVKLFHEAQYADLLGGLLEALARLLADNVKIYVFPMELEAFRLALGGGRRRQCHSRESSTSWTQVQVASGS